jgi:hypothetical protein
MAAADPPGSGNQSALDASLRLIAELGEAMSGQVSRVLRQIEAASTLSVPSRTVEVLAAEARGLAAECRALRDRLGPEDRPVTPSGAAGPRPAAPIAPRAAPRADAARTLALELRALGVDREEIASRLVNTFEVDDPEAIVEGVFTEP